MIKDEITARMRKAMKEGRVVEREILGVALGEIQTVEHRAGKGSDEAEAEAIVRKIIKSNEETLRVAPQEEARARLAEENVVLRSLLPQTLDVAAIVAALAGVADAVRAAGNDGQATGVAVKALKAAGAAVIGKDVADAVRQMRTRPGN